MIPFTNIPANVRVPGFYVELDPSRANSYSGQNARTLLIGQKLAAGIGVANTARICSGQADADKQCGVGSMLSLMFSRYRQADSVGEVWLLPLVDDGAGAAAIGGILFTAPATANGTLPVYIGDVRVNVAVTSSMTSANLATAVAAALTAVPDLPLTAVVDTVTPTPEKVILTAKNKGLAQNDIAITFAAGGALAGESVPTGLAATITPMAGGTTNPSMTTALANLLDAPFDFVVIPYNDSTSLNALKDFFSDTTGRWSFNRQVFGHGWAAFRGDLAASTTLGAARNDQHVSIMPENKSLTPHWLWAAGYTGASAPSLRADPGRPLTDLSVPGIAAPALADRFGYSDQNALLFSGMSTYNVANDGGLQLQKVITTYQKNPAGTPDDSYLAVQTMYQLMYILRRLRGYVTSTYSRFKLAKDGTRLAPGVAVVTPKQIRAGIVAEYRQMEYEGMAQGADAFADLIIVEQNTTNPNRVDVLYPPELMNQLEIFAVLAQFRL